MHLDPQNAPKGPGIYIFKDLKENILYVGKAKSLKNRVKSYFQNTKQHTTKTRLMLKNAVSLEYILTDTELEALILESNLIKKHHPRYNILLKDDKSYPYIRISLEEDYPRAFITRRLGIKGSRYIGPYTDVHEIRKTLRYLNQIFGIRTCKDKKFNRLRPCLNYDIRRCSGPCTKNISKENYRKNIEELMLFLTGKNKELIKDLEKTMMYHSRKQEYEASKLYRDRIEGIMLLASNQKIVSHKREDMDIIVAVRKTDTILIQILFIRSGSLISKMSYPFRDLDITEESLINSFLKQYYTRHEIPQSVIISHDIEDQAVIRDWLAKASHHHHVRIEVPKRGEKHKLIQLAQKNADMNLDEYIIRQEKNRLALTSLKDKLNLLKLPRRIEAFDISNISGRHAVGSMVVFIDGEPVKDKYRKYKIRTVEGIDDYAMMCEVIKRRYSKHNLPDLILVDGGRGQLNAAIKILNNLRKAERQILGLAKEFEEIYLPHKSSPVTLDSNSSALYLLQRVRDEAHRFAVSYHKHLRSKSITG